MQEILFVVQGPDEIDAGAVIERSVAAHMVSLRRLAYPFAPIQDWRAGADSGWCAAQGGARCSGQDQAQPNHLADFGRTAMDTGRIPSVVGEGVRQGAHRWCDLQ